MVLPLRSADLALCAYALHHGLPGVIGCLCLAQTWLLIDVVHNALALDSSWRWTSWWLGVLDREAQRGVVRRRRNFSIYIHLYIFIYVMYDGTAMMMKKMEIRKVL